MVESRLWSRYLGNDGTATKAAASSTAGRNALYGSLPNKLRDPENARPSSSRLLRARRDAACPTVVRGLGEDQL